MSMLVRVLGEKGSSATAALETLGTCTMVSVLHFFFAPLETAFQERVQQSGRLIVYHALLCSLGNDLQDLS